MVAATPPEAISRHLEHLRVQRRLADSTLGMYADALARLNGFCEREGVALAAVQAHHARGWVARLHAQGLGPRSLAITLSAWRGFYRWLGREGDLAVNPIDGLKPPKAPKPLPKALSVDQAMALAEQLPLATITGIDFAEHRETAYELFNSSRGGTSL